MAGLEQISLNGRNDRGADGFPRTAGGNDGGGLTDEVAPGLRSFVSDPCPARCCMTQDDQRGSRWIPAYDCGNDGGEMDDYPGDN